jgi:hypothetical protein
MSTQEENTAPNNSVEAEEGVAKRKSDVEQDTTESKRVCTTNDNDKEVLDIATMLGYKPGDRFVVQWEVHSDESEDKEPTTRWWGATLLEHDGRTEDSVAIRVLDYDPYTEGGFPERSEEDVIFLGKDTLVNPVTQDEMTYRPEGDEAVWLGREDVEGVVNATLEKAFQKNSQAWKSMSSAQQAVIAGTIAEKKEKLLDLLLAQPNGVITSNDMKSILTKTMEGR